MNMLKINQNGIDFQVLNGEKGNISLPKLKWAISRKKNISDSFKIGDIIFVKKKIR